MIGNKKICIKVKHLVLLLVLFLFFGYLFLTNIHPFLAKQNPIQAEILVIEGWVQDYALEQVKKEFETATYQILVTTGGPLEKGSLFSGFKDYATLAASLLREMGIDSGRIFSVPAPAVLKDRTFASALALKEWILKNQLPYRKMNIISLGVHARRSHFLFRKALGKDFSVGIITIADRNYDRNRWWKSSYGVRSILDEWFAYCYARLWFLFDKKKFR